MNQNEEKSKNYKVREGNAYLTKEGVILICVGTWNDGMKLFERSEGNTPFCSGRITHMEAVNVMRVK